MIRRLRWIFQSPLIPRATFQGWGWKAEWGHLTINGVSHGPLGRWRAIAGVVMASLWGGISVTPDWVWHGFEVVVSRCPECEKKRIRIKS